MSELQHADTVAVCECCDGRGYVAAEGNSPEYGIEECPSCGEQFDGPEYGIEECPFCGEQFDGTGASS